MDASLCFAADSVMSCPFKHRQDPDRVGAQFYYTVAAHTPHYHEMVGNPICKQIGWDDNEEFYLAW